MVVLRRPPSATGDFGGTKLSLLLEKQHNRGQDGAGAAILHARPVPGEEPYWIAKSASSSPLADVLTAIARRENLLTGLTGLGDNQNPVNPVNPVKKKFERIFLGHLRYATFGKNEVAFCHPFVHEASELEHTLLLAGNFNLTNAYELFDDYSRHGSFPTSKADGYLICELIAHELAEGIASALSKALADADGAWTLCGATGDGWAFATRDPHGIRPGWYYISDDVVTVTSERPAIQAAFDVPPEAVKELPPGQALIISPSGEVQMVELCSTVNSEPRPCSFERIYFSRANDADIHRERKALGAALLPQILEAADAPLGDIFFSYIPNSARIAFHGLLESIFKMFLSQRCGDAEILSTGLTRFEGKENPDNPVNSVKISFPRFGEIAVKDAKFRTFIADAAARREFYKHVYDVTYGLVRPGKDTLVVLDDSIVRGNTMKNAILPMLDRLGPKRIIIASSAPPIRYPDCYGIDMSTLDELVAFRALVKLLGDNAEKLLTGLTRFTGFEEKSNPVNLVNPVKTNPLATLYARFTDEQHCTEIARLLTPAGMKAEVKVVYQTVENLRKCLCETTSDNRQPTTATTIRQTTSDSPAAIGDWYFTGDYPTPGGYKVLHKALENYIMHKSERSY